ncbi:TPA: HAD-IA family hydrolase [Neisseria meningitidis]
MPEIIRDLLEMPSETAVADIARTYSAHYLNPNNRNMTLFPDALPCLDKLKAQGYWLAVATGKGRAGLDNAISQTATGGYWLATGGYWLATACAGEYPSKPSPEMVFGLCGELGFDPKEALVVGDTAHDLHMAANAGAAAVGVATGAHSREQLRTAPHLAVLDGLSELPGFLAQHYA